MTERSATGAQPAERPRTIPVLLVMSAAVLVLAGADFVTPGPARKRVNMAVGTAQPAESAKPAFGNIAPYRKSMYCRIAANWHAKTADATTGVVEVTIEHDGTLIHSKLIQSSGSKIEDERMIRAIESTSFEPLPEWYQGRRLKLKIPMRDVQQLKQKPLSC